MTAAGDVGSVRAVADDEIEYASSDKLTTILGLGVLLQIAGVVAALATDPDTGILFYIGLALAGIGSVLALIGAVGWGVLLALRAHARD